METELEVIDAPNNFAPATNIEPDLNVFEIEDEANAGPSAEDLAAKYAAQEAELERLKQSASLSDGMTQGFQTLAQQLQAQKGNQFDNLPGLPQAPAQIQNQYAMPDKEAFEREFLTNPYDAFSKFLAPVVGNQQNAINSQMTEMNKMISKNNAYMNESNKDILSKYGEEVGAYASRLPGNDPWTDAVKQVRSNHFSDIMAEREKSIEQKMYEKAKADLLAEQNPTDQRSPVGSTNMGANTNPPAAKVKVTKAQMDKVKKMTTLKFGPDSGPEVELQMYNYLKDRNEL